MKRRGQKTLLALTLLLLAAALSLRFLNPQLEISLPSATFAFASYKAHLAFALFTGTAGHFDFSLRASTGQDMIFYYLRPLPGFSFDHGNGANGVSIYILNCFLTWPVLILLTAALLQFRLLRRPQPLPNHCPTCGYDLRATPSRCPKCGKQPEISGQTR